MSRDRVDILKGVAIVAVILIHGLNYSAHGVKLENFTGGIIFDQILRFCVPVFVGVSGYALASKYLHQPLKGREYFSRRVMRLLPGYFIWTGIYWLTARLVPALGTYNQATPWWELLLGGQAEYHLYFVPMIFQLYVIFPWLFKLIQKWPKLLGVIAIGQVAILIVINRLGWYDQGQYILGLTWIWFFSLGIAWAIRPPRLNIWVLAAVAGLGLIGGIWQAIGIARVTGDLILATRFTKIPIFIYATAIFGLGLTLQIKEIPKFKRGLVWLGKNSFPIYLGHVLVLKIIFSLI